MNKIDELVQRNHDFWASCKNVHLASPEYYAEMMRHMKVLIGDYLTNPGMRAIDVGCGNGENTLVFSPHLAHIDGYELSANLVEEARRLNPLPNGDYYQIDIEKDSFPVEDNSLDIIFLLGVVSSIHSNENLVRMFRNFHKYLKPDGLLITRDSLSKGYTYRRPVDCGYFAIYRSVPRFLEMFDKSGFRLEETREVSNQEKITNSFYVFRKVSD